ncbi:MAG: hypothetical protein QXD51_02470 [Candidatus Anstonellales archaeon]
MRKLLHLFFIMFFLLSSGCLIDKEKVKQVFETPSYEFDARELMCGGGQCVAFICNQSKENDYTVFYPPPVVGSNCSFEVVETEKEYKEYLAGKEEFLRTFGAGFGSSFMEFADANAYCNNSLTYSVKWVLGNTTTGYVLPSPERATCFFEKSTLPVYILYAGGPFVPVNKVAEFAGALDTKGPAIVVTEYSYNSSDPIEIAAISSQAKTIKQKCKNCIVAVYTKMNDDAILKEMQKDSELNKSVDLVAFGLDGRETPHCSGGWLINNGMNFSRLILYTYGKPSLWAYILIPRGFNEKGMCVWNEVEEKRAYISLFISVGSMRKYGVIGFAPYSLYGNPLKCENCTLMENGEPRQDSFSTFFSYCQQFYYYYSFLPVAYATKPGTNCSFEKTPSFPIFFGQSSSEIDVPLYTVDSQMPYFYKCAACFSFNDTIPSGISGSGSDYHCTDGIGKTIDYWADVFEVDPDYMKAIAQQESGFDECAVGLAPPDWSYCNPNAVPFEDPTGKCNEKIQNKLNNYCWDKSVTKFADPSEACKPCSSVSSGNNGGHCKICAMGMMQVIDYPGYYYKQQGEEVPDRIKLCGAYEYNPFNMNDSACARSYYAMTNAKKARELIAGLSSNERSALGITDENVGWWVALFASYAANQSTMHRWITDYIENRPQNCYGLSESACYAQACCIWDDEDEECKYAYSQTCCGAKTFFEYLESDGCLYKPYGVQVLRKYINAWRECRNCDEGQFLDNFKKYHPPSPGFPGFGGK